MISSYLLPKTVTQSTTFLNQLKKRLPMIKESYQQGTCYYFDTFDWRLYRQGYCLFHLKDHLHLYQHQKKNVEEKQEYHFSTLNLFNLPEGILQMKVSPILGIRALMCRGTFHLKISTFRILNREQKTIARLNVEQSKFKVKTQYRFMPLIIEIEPLRGYTNQLPAILKKISAKKLSISKDDRLKRGLATIGEQPATYSSKPNIKFTKDMTAPEATKLIYLHLTDIIQRNTNGIINDIDTEFLHDFRVSVRRTRSALGQLKNVLDETIMQKAKENFSFLGRSTNKLRDIDVYLLRENQYKLMLPVKLRDYINPFFEELHVQRKLEHRALVKMIRSVKFKKILSDWSAYLNSKNIGKKEDDPLAKNLARKIIIKRNKRVLKFGRQILTTGSDELLHQLRIEGKKLRYLLEFFSSLFVEAKIQYLINKLKILQDNLGNFNDLVVQQERLFEATNNISARTKNGKNTILALGFLAGKLSERQQIVKNDFARTFKNYSDPEVQKIFTGIFYEQGRRVK